MATYIESDPYVPPPKPKPAPVEEDEESGAIFIESDVWQPEVVKVERASAPVDDDAIYIESEPYVPPAPTVVTTTSTDDEGPTFIESDVYIPPAPKEAAKPAYNADEEGPTFIESDPYTPPAPVKVKPAAEDERDGAIFIEPDPPAPARQKKNSPKLDARPQGCRETTCQQYQWTQGSHAGTGDQTRGQTGQADAQGKEGRRQQCVVRRGGAGRAGDGVGCLRLRVGRVPERGGAGEAVSEGSR